MRHEAGAAATARSRIGAELSAVGVDPRVIDDVVLVASELVTNAVRHTAGDDLLTVSWELVGAGVVVSVDDSSLGAPTLRNPRPEDPSGRGIPIVDALSSEWGVIPRLGDGKQVWARITGR